jgi:hypothetical protein
MINKPFGAAFSFIYYPLISGDAINPPTGQTPDIYVFDKMPGDEAARNGNGAISTISTWIETTANQRTFTVPAIADPNDGTTRKRYWVAINYVAATGGTQTLDIQIFELVRPSGFTTDPTPTYNEVKDLDKTLTTYFTDDEIRTGISVAKTAIRMKLQNDGFKWAQIKNPEDLKTAITYKALAHLWVDEIVEENDRFWLKYKEAEAIAEGLLNSLRLQYDQDENHDLDDDEENVPAANFVRFSR